MTPALILIAAAWAADADDAALIEQLVRHAPVATAPAAAAKPAKNAKAAPEAAASLVGQRVRVRTIDRGVYTGTLESVDANALVLRIDLKRGPLSYTLPRHGVTEINPEVAP